MSGYKHMIDIEIRKKVYSQILDKQKYLYENPTSGGLLFALARKYDLLQGEVYKTFAVTVGDIILGFYKIEDTVPLLQQELGLDPRTAALLGADVLDFLAPLSDPNWQPPAEAADGDEEILNDDTYQFSVAEENNPELTNSVAEQTPSLTPADNNTPPPVYEPLSSPVTAVSSPIPKPPQPPNPALHTMASDMEATRRADQSELMTTPSLNLEHTPTYISQNQDSLRRPLSDTPTYTPAPTQTTLPSHNIEPPRWSAN